MWKGSEIINGTSPYEHQQQQGKALCFSFYHLDKARYIFYSNVFYLSLFNDTVLHKSRHYSAATLNGRTLDHCLGETARGEVGKQHSMG